MEDNSDFNASQFIMHQYNMDSAQREIDSRAAQGEDMSDAYIQPVTYEVLFFNQGE